MKYKLIILFYMTLICSCKEDIYYGTSISIENELNDKIKVILYPAEDPFHFMEELIIDPGFNQSLYSREKTDLNILTLMTDVFDSVLIFNSHDSFVLKFSPDTSINCNFNPYKDISIWASEIIEGDMHTNFSNTHTITENYYFHIGVSNIISR